MTIFRHLQDQKRRNMMLCAGDGWRGRDMKVWGTKKGLFKGGKRDSEPFAWDMPMSRIWERDATVRTTKKLYHVGSSGIGERIVQDFVGS
ncbi:hypothetical protein AVEN_170198-1 [Araneus ventricosus]|uniref:Uncharacterized protein n=1 Tax=Araneus ventricosus TaxID=182803 RepID=A0A4Y2LUT8_ARAVE|nr:hypothetical protein AVEN_79451-1 [Araneus ventricosus]GBN18972.1 hypothetical protein AVEN_152006-1 [Araneus ventricosus]GBN57843.1 hypothetical protein AVEN_216099-1 [Araneus ventricosus]GBN57941.1 hypothetical protein AVEN_170198-1 [Araneus ventricosus]